MAINLIVGLPRSGKSLFAVYKLEQLKKEGCYTIGNIDGYDFDERCPTKPDEFSSLILTTNWEEKSKSLGKKMILVLDESQRNYGTYGMNRSNQNELFYFLEYHGHYGLDIYLITQDRKSLHERVLSLVSTIYQTQVSLGGKNRVKRLSNTWDVLETFEFDGSAYYNKYKTALNEFGNQIPPNSLKALFKKIGIYIIVIICLISYLFYYISTKYLGGSNETALSHNPDSAIVDNNTNNGISKASLNQNVKSFKSKSIIDLKQLKLVSTGRYLSYDLNKFEYKGGRLSVTDLRQLGYTVIRINDAAFMIEDNLYLLMDEDEEELRGESRRAKSANVDEPSEAGKTLVPVM